MAKKVPKHIRRKIERMNDLMEQIVNLNMSVEAWAEKHGAQDGYDISGSFRDYRGYGIFDVESYIEAIEKAID